MYIKTIQLSYTGSSMKYECIACGFKTTRKNDYNRHMLTNKHIKKTCIIHEKSSYLDLNYMFCCKYCQKPFKNLSSEYVSTYKIFIQRK